MEDNNMEYMFTEENFENEVLKNDIPVLVDFYADWCGPCKMMMPVIEKLAEKYDGKVKVGKVNSDDNGSLAGNYNIMSIPSFLIFKNGEVVDSAMGAMSMDVLAAKLDAVL
jgi:thioredoxin 1